MKKKTTLKDYRQLIAGQHAAIFGVGVTAFNRVGLGMAVPDLEILCYDNSSDLVALEQSGIPIVSIARDYDVGIKRENSFRVLSHPKVSAYLDNQKHQVYVCLYRSIRQMDALCAAHGWKLIANPTALREQFENKKVFRDLALRLGLPVIPGKNYPISILEDKEAFHSFSKEWGESLVFQLPEVSRGGGGNTFFVKNRQDCGYFLKNFRQLSQEKKLSSINVTKFIQGVPASITGCATRHGILYGVVQTQIIDQLLGFEHVDKKILDTPHGKFNGHDWSFRQYSSVIQKKAWKIVEILGAHMYAQGYKGIFGVDLMIDGDEVYITECNPRYTGAFPLYTMLQLAKDEIPMDVFQVLEFLDITYPLDIAAINRQWQRPKQGAHIVLSNRFKQWLRVGAHVKAGVYRYEKGKLLWTRDGFGFADICNAGEFVYTDGCPNKGDLVHDNKRLGRLIFGQGILDEKGQLHSEVAEVIDAFYQQLALEILQKEPYWDEKKQQHVVG